MHYFVVRIWVVVSTAVATLGLLIPVDQGCRGLRCQHGIRQIGMHSSKTSERLEFSEAVPKRLHDTAAIWVGASKKYCENLLVTAALGGLMFSGVAAGPLPVHAASTPSAFVSTLAIAEDASVEAPASKASSASQPKVTAVTNLDIAFGSKSAPGRSVKLGIYGNEAPQASKLFLLVCKGEYKAGISYDEAQVSKIEKGRRIDVGKLALGAAQKQETYMDGAGKVRIRSVNQAAQALHNDANALKHDGVGVVSVPKGGGSFEFTITPAANPTLDEDHLVIGKVLSGLDVIDQINEIPVSREDSLGTKGFYSNLGKGFDGRAKIASINKPLQKVFIKQCSVSEEASVASFLKF
jgi:cyclophilin family peptidyl-prolyl cis-trans isomerase